MHKGLQICFQQGNSTYSRQCTYSREMYHSATFVS
jgi:hypothetical protein